MATGLARCESSLITADAWSPTSADREDWDKAWCTLAHNRTVMHYMGPGHNNTIFFFMLEVRHVQVLPKVTPPPDWIDRTIIGGRAEVYGATTKGGALKFALSGRWDAYQPVTVDSAMSPRASIAHSSR